MSKEHKDIDQLVRKQLDGFEMAPPADVWTKTEAALLTGARNRRKFGWIFFGAGLIVLITSTVYLIKPDTSTTTTMAEDTLVENSASASKNSSEEKLKKINGSRIEQHTDGRNDALESTPFNDSQAQQKTHIKEAAAIDNYSNNNSPSKTKRVVATENKSDTDSNKGKSIALEADKNNTSDQNLNYVNAGKSYLPSTLSTEFKATNRLPFHSIELFTFPRTIGITHRFEEDSLPEHIPFWRNLSVEGSIGISHFTVQPSKKTNEPEFISLLNNASTKRIGYDVHFGLNYHFEGSGSFQTGLEYSSSRENYAFTKAETTTYTYMDTVSYSIDSTTMDTTYNINPVNSTSTTYADYEEQNFYQFLLIPFHFVYEFHLPRAKIEFALGGTLSIAGRNSGTIILNSDNYVLPAPVAHHARGMLSVSTSLKYLRPIGNKQSLYIEPWARFGVTNQSTPALGYFTHRHTYGVRVGYRFYF